MIIKGNPRCDTAFWAAHLVRTDHNERVGICEIRGLGGQGVRECLMELDAIAEGTRTRNGFYVASLNPRDDELLTAGQWQQAADILERQLGLDGQARFIVEHEKEGRTHRHVIWGRIDPDTMKAIPADFNYQKHEQAAREIEQELGLAPLHSVLVKDRDAGRPERRPQDWEGFRAADSKIDPQAMKAELTALWQAADSGLAFKAALEEAGYILAKGDRRDFVIIDCAGDDHSLARRISGVKAAGIRARMADVDRNSLPGVAEARALARAATGSTDATAGPQAAGPVQEPPQETPDDRQAGLAPEGERRRDGLIAEGDRSRDNLAPEGQRSREDWIPEGDRNRDGLIAEPEHCSEPGETRRALPWGSAWRAFADRARALSATLYELWGDESSGTPDSERSVTHRLVHAGRKLWTARAHRDGRGFAEALEEAAQAAREAAMRILEAAQPPDHALPDGQHRDGARPGGNVEPPEPDDKPQEKQDAALGPPTRDAFDDAVEDYLAAFGQAGPEAETADEPEPDGPSRDGQGQQGPDMDDMDIEP